MLKEKRRPMFNKDFNSILEVAREFATEEKCIEHLEALYWNNKPVSPFHEDSTVYKCKGNKYKCKTSGKYFTVKTGSIFDNTKIELPKWFMAIFLVTNHKKGISSVQLGKDLQISQKSAWFMLMRIRKCFGIENDIDDKFEGICEADESFFGGKNKNRHKDKKVPQSQGRSFKDKTPVIGVLQRGESEIIDGKKIIHSHSKVKCIVGNNTKSETIQPFIKSVVVKDSVLISDEWLGYRGLENHYDHHVVDHGKKQYVNFDNPEIHSNSMEGFWGIIKRGYNGTYNWWSKKHMQNYVDEFVFRFNLRTSQNNERFNSLLLNSQIRTKYKDLMNA
ncbi:hypothetical protein FLACHUCJ7_03502 [Flavobacterium chungangense]|uniref:ISXO2-like transposase domain-containing protein n=2 Tax=Flavobacterium chungangense TaxID=554283 RepID=A0A6V6Z7U4_9FLAO|nr:hypothetical protein FLACHUCJ7_03502 [Flavobacterium chungangense]